MARELLALNIIYLWPGQNAIKKQWSVFQNGRPTFPISFPHNSVGIQSRGNGFQECIKAPSLHHWNTIPNTWVERWTGGAWREECECRQGKARVARHWPAIRKCIHSPAAAAGFQCVPTINETLVFRLGPLFWHAVTRQHVTTEWPQEVTGRCQSPDHKPACRLLFRQILWNSSRQICVCCPFQLPLRCQWNQWTCNTNANTPAHQRKQSKNCNLDSVDAISHLLPCIMLPIGTSTSSYFLPSWWYSRWNFNITLKLPSKNIIWQIRFYPPPCLVLDMAAPWQA